MRTEAAEIEAWLSGEWASRLAAAIEEMAGERPAVSVSALAALPESVSGRDRADHPVQTESPEQAEAAERAGMEGVCWRQTFAPLAGSAWVVAPSESVEACGAAVVRSVGVEDSSEAERRSAFLEVLRKTQAGLAQALSSRVKQETIAAQGAESSAAALTEAAWFAASFTLTATPVTLHFGIEAALVESIRGAESESSANAEPPTVARQSRRSSLDHSKTFPLLLEVELPVAVSFGRANIPLKDVLKLTTGSIVELNRAVSEPVEIIVNNCVIARGEVVVVEGNFGVRIQEVIDRQDRLRTVR